MMYKYNILDKKKSIKNIYNLFFLYSHIKITFILLILLICIKKIFFFYLIINYVY